MKVYTWDKGKLISVEEYPDLPAVPQSDQEKRLEALEVRIARLEAATV